jgi:hypothetical protein
VTDRTDSPLHTTIGTMILRIAHLGQFYLTLHLNWRLKLIETAIGMLIKVFRTDIVCA